MFDTDQRIIIKGQQDPTLNAPLIEPFTAVRLKVGAATETRGNPVFEAGVLTTTRQLQPFGISSDWPNKVGQPVNAIVFGRTKMRLAATSGAIFPGQWLTTEATTGRGVAATAGQYSIARALTSGNSGELIEVLVYPAITPA